MLTRLALLAVLAVPQLALAAKTDKVGCKDHPLFTRMPNFYLVNCKEAQFDARKFTIPDGKRSKQESIEGHFYQVTYNYDGDPRPSILQWVRNYQNAVKQVGGEVVFDDQKITTLKLKRGDTETWVEASTYGGNFSLFIVERQAMVQQVQVNAAALSSSLAASGHAVVDGIFFDTGLSVVKPESAPALAEVAKMMTAEPDLKLRVVGHTDSVGALDANTKLSQARAEAVVQYLLKQHKVAANRLIAHGVASLAPVASNRAEEGRARNRRVELIEQ